MPCPGRMGMGRHGPVEFSLGTIPIQVVADILGAL